MLDRGGCCVGGGAVDALILRGEPPKGYGYGYGSGYGDGSGYGSGYGYGFEKIEALLTKNES